MKFGVVGCGTIAQIMHLPYLAEVPKAELFALTDISADRVETVADRYNVPNRYETAESMLSDVGNELDAVVVLTPAHAHTGVVEATLGRGIHTLVEKPLAATLGDADRMVDAAEASDAVAMVAYMKRYDPAYERAKEEIEAFAEIDLVTAYDVDPDHGRIIDEVYDLVGGSFPEGFIEDSIAERRAQIAEAIGSKDDALIDAYDFQLDHVCHDVNALRGLFGDIERIDDVAILADGRYLTARFEFTGGTTCILESGDSDRKWFEQFIRLDSPDGMLKLDFSNPFIQNTPTELRVKRGVDTLENCVHTPSYEEPFKRELEQFIACIEGEKEVRTTFREAREDLGVIIDLFRAHRDVPLTTIEHA